MATEVHEGAANGSVKKDQVEPLGELKGKEDLKKAADLTHAKDANGCEPLAEKDEPLAKLPTPNKQKGIVHDGVEEEPQDANDYSSEEEGDGDGEGEGEGEEDTREAEGEPYEEDDDEEYVDDGEDEEGDDEESQPPPKRRK